MPAVSTTAPAVAITARRTVVRAVVIWLVGGLMSAFERHRNAIALVRSLATAHLGALLLQDRLARQLDAVALDGQHLHQNLIAFLQLIAHIVDTVLCDFADVQQSVSAWNDLDERAEVRRPGDFAEICLPAFDAAS